MLRMFVSLYDKRMCSVNSLVSLALAPKQEGYSQKIENQMKIAAYLRHFIKNLKHPNGQPRFELLDGGDTCCLPVVAARLNRGLGLHYNDIDLQHALSESHWYVSGYSLGFENPESDDFEQLFTDVTHEMTMFRIVVKSNITMVSLTSQDIPY